MTLRHRIQRARGQLEEYQRFRALMKHLDKDLRPPAPGTFARFGTGSVIVPPARVTRADCIEIGDDVQILEHAWLSVKAAVPGIQPRLVIGDGCRIGRFASIACVGEVIFGDKVLTADRIFIGDTYHCYEDVSLPVVDQPMADPAPVEIGSGAFLGIGSAVLHGVRVGEGAYVGAGAVVTEDIPPYTAVAGNPARAIKQWNPATEKWERPI